PPSHIFSRHTATSVMHTLSLHDALPIYSAIRPTLRYDGALTRACCKSPFCAGARMPTSANCPKTPSRFFNHGWTRIHTDGERLFSYPCPSEFIHGWIMLVAGPCCAVSPNCIRL